MLKKRILLLLTAVGLVAYPVTQETEFLVNTLSVLFSLF